jgi:serine/threonine protein kinase
VIAATPFTASPADLRDDDLLADAIEADGRDCVARGEPVTLERYLRAVPDLEMRTVPLDAAIDVALRSAARERGAQRPDSSDAQKVAAVYPRLHRAISDALMLDGGLMTTHQVQAPVRPEPLTGLPRDFGPLLPDGRERYTLTRLIGAGASGTVYSATDRHLSEPDRPAEVAIKVLASRRADAWLSRRLTEEATKARRVDHPAVVRVLDRGGEQTDSPYIVYELVKGGDLQTWYEQQNKRVPIRRAVEIVAQIARGVQAAHAAGLVHSDLKPANVLLDDSGRAKVADFGIAARLHWALQERAGDAGDSAPPAGPVGNMAFIAPEQFRAEPGCFSVPADVYALGGVLYALLTGTYPNGDSPAQVARNHGNASDAEPYRPPSARSIRPEIDRSLDLMCRRALAPRPDERYPSAAALADDLEAWLESRPISWQKPSPALVFRLWIRRRPAVAVSSAAAVVLLVAGLISTGYYARIAGEKEERLANARNSVLELRDILKQPSPDGKKITPKEFLGKLDPLERTIAPSGEPPVSPRPPQSP